MNENRVGSVCAASAASISGCYAEREQDVLHTIPYLQMNLRRTISRLNTFIGRVDVSRFALYFEPIGICSLVRASIPCVSPQTTQRRLVHSQVNNLVPDNLLLAGDDK